MHDQAEPQLKLAISNLAWPAELDAEAVTLVARIGFAGIELAPSQVFGPIESIELPVVADYGKRLAGLGLTVPSLQGILFGVPRVHLFRSESERSRLALMLRRVAEIAGTLGARACVFGAPALRDPGEMPYETAREEAVHFFRDIGPVFQDAGTALCFEANPALYHCKFITSTSEAFEFVRDIDQAGIRLQLDTGTMFINNEPADIIDRVASKIGHVHASEPNLVPTGTSGLDHAPIAAALRRVGYRGFVSVEIRKTSEPLPAIEEAWRVVSAAYAARPTP